jgi:carbon monoxide dehydrogenase subunit G
MAVRPDPDTSFRRPGDHLRSERIVERRVFVQASPRVVWATLHDPTATPSLFPELRLGPAVPSWPAAATTRTARAQVGLLRESAHVESLEARPESVFRMRVSATGFDSEWSWRLEPVAGGTRVIHAATFEPIDRWAGILVRLGRRSLAARVEAHLRALKERSERSGFASA